MAEEKNTSSSQESLPLSQETFTSLWTELQSSLPPNVISDTNLDGFSDYFHVEEIHRLEHIGHLSASIEIPQALSQASGMNYVPSSLPAIENWPGDYSFTVSFNTQEKTTKGVAWTYSEQKRKLYVGKDVPCPINFSTSAFMPENTSIRAMALFSSAEHATSVVTRCVNHSMDEINRGIAEAEHLIRCESSMASYQVDGITGRHSVVVPYENPAVGQHFSTYIYKFACFGSCSGGPNRRPLILIFTLEQRNKVIGRCKLELKICACPGRDRATEEKQLAEQNNSHTSRRMEIPDISKFSQRLNILECVLPLQPSKKQKLSHPTKGYYTIKVRDPECYDFLKEMKKFFEMCKVLRAVSPESVQAFFAVKTSSEDEKPT